eukprot:TRINITY_DN1854_c1_g2_i1.p1 TRINITY_DN1854_c1_g2~~TRINITY_DN1854_c1_g2_i1.p1  ORF type:complete len:362 (+),score=56.97 TRINITY_DN1854_c1_g2_i1:97-1182(+)
MRLGHAIWRNVSRGAAATGAGTATSSSCRVPPAVLASSVPDMPLLASDLGASTLARLERKPWVMISDVRVDFESKLQLTTDELLLILAQWLAQVSSAPASVGLAHVSGNVYFGPSIDFGTAGHLSPEQVLIGNLFSHGEIGVDAYASDASPSSGSSDLLLELATLKRFRWLDSASFSYKAQTDETQTPIPSEERKMGEVVKLAKKSLFKKYPLVRDLLRPHTCDPGNCLQHPGFVHHDIEGDSLDEIQDSQATIAAKRAYCPPEFREDSVGADIADRPASGCSLQTKSGKLYAGSEIISRTGVGGLSPIQCALVSLGANGENLDSVVSAAWCPGSGATQRLQEQEEALLRVVAPQASFRWL